MILFIGLEGDILVEILNVFVGICLFGGMDKVFVNFDYIDFLVVVEMENFDVIVLFVVEGDQLKVIFVVFIKCFCDG